MSIFCYYETTCNTHPLDEVNITPTVFATPVPMDAAYTCRYSHAYGALTFTLTCLKHLPGPGDRSSLKPARPLAYKPFHKWLKRLN